MVLFNVIVMGGYMGRKSEDDYVENCPISNVQKIVRGKWTMKELRTLEEYRIIHREIYKEVPPKVEYSLTELGVKFLPVLKSLEKWAIEYEKMLKQ